MQLEITSTPQSKMHIPLPSTSATQIGKNMKRKTKASTQDQEVIKGIEETEREAHHSP